MENILAILISIMIASVFFAKPIVAISKSQNKKQELKNQKQMLLLSLIVLLGCLLRTVAISSFPAGFNQDEASIGYEAYCLANFGMDRNGVTFPVHLISWGSGQNALYAYILIPFLNIFQLTVFSTRLPMAIIGCLAILIFYQVAKILLPKHKELATFIFAINPWHIAKSRWALESNLFPDIFLLGFMLLLLAINGKKYFYILSGIVFGISTYAYGTSYFILPIFCGTLFLILLLKKRASLLHAISFFAPLAIVALPMMIFVIQNRTSAENISILGVTIPKLFQNRQTYIMNFDGGFFQVLKQNATETFKLIFSQYDELPWNAMKFFGTTFKITTPIMVVGICRSVREKDTKELPMLLWLSTAVVMLLLITANINRSNIIITPMIFFTAKGFATLIDMSKKSKAIVAKSIVCLLSVLSISFSICYFGDSYKNTISFQFFDGAMPAIEYAEENFNQVIITNQINQPYIFYLFQTKISPMQYLETREVANPNEAFEYISKIGNIQFGNIAFEDIPVDCAYVVSIYDLGDISEEDYNIVFFDLYAVVFGKV